MTARGPEPATLQTLDVPTRELVRLAAVVTAGSEAEIRERLAEARGVVPDVWIEELLLQTHLFAGFPRALNGMREWRRISGRSATDAGRSTACADAFRSAGEATCRQVYGAMYDRLRDNIRGLDPLLDDWMISDGYGKVLSRPGLDLGRRELCIVAACAAAGQERQLHSHLHGALNVGVVPLVVDAVVAALEQVLAPDSFAATRLLWLRVKGK